MISVIVPVYKVEQYLKTCIESILNQSYQDLEIILVDDGSPDSCPQICDEYAGKDSRIKVIHKENGGVSSARNAGIEIAQGEYVAFIDPDDIIEPTMFERLLAEMDESTDIVECTFYMFDEEGNILENEWKIKNQVIEGENCLLSVLNGNIYGAVWAKLFKKTIIKDIRFREDLQLSEDTFFVLRCCENATKVKQIDYKGYGYFQRFTSVMREKLNDKQWTKFLYLDIIKQRYPQEECLVYIAFNEYATCRYYITKIFLDNVYQEKIKDLRKRCLATHKLLRRTKLLHFKDKCFLFALRFAPHLLYLLIKIRIKLNKGKNK